MVDAGWGEWGFMAEKSAENEGGVDGVTVADLLNDFGVAEIDILKMDIEGSEKEVFEGSCPWLSKVKMLIIELHERMRPGVEAAFFSAIAPHDFKISAKGEHLILIRKSDSNKADLQKK